MFSAIRRRMRITPATVIAGLALVFAMSGGAYAAKKYLITSTKQISPSVLKALQGKAGAPGVAGALGAQGPAGPAGSAGPGGAKGETGSAGERGLQGEKGIQGLQGKEGKAGATGATGASGATGFTETLPSGKTETGNWNATGSNTSTTYLPFAISFPIPLKAPSTNIVYLTAEETETSMANPVQGCKLELENPAAKPIAPPDTLCVFTRFDAHGKVVMVGENIGEASDSPAGTYLWIEPSLSEVGAEKLHFGLFMLYGTWAVTAP